MGRPSPSDAGGDTFAQAAPLGDRDLRGTTASASVSNLIRESRGESSVPETDGVPPALREGVFRGRQNIASVLMARRR